MADEGQTATTEEADPKKRSPLIMLLVLAVGAGGGFVAGTSLVAPRVLASRTADAGAEEHGTEDKSSASHGGPEESGEHGGEALAEEGEGHFLEMGNLLVNPRGSRGLRFLMVTVALEVIDDNVRSMLRVREAQVRDVVISVLEQQTLEQLSAPGGRDSVRTRIREAVKDAFELNEVNVFLPQFVIN